MNIAAIRAFAKSLSGVDNTNEGGPAPFPDVEVTTTTLPNATVGTPYSQQLAATGGDGGYTWVQITGTLPAGLSLSTSGLISGTPTTATTYNFTVQADDGLGAGNSTDSQALSIVVSPSSGVADWSFDWDDYADDTEMLAAVTDSSTGPGGISLLTGLTGTPWGGTKALRCSFLASGSPSDHQVGATLYMNAAASAPTEVWMRTYVRWSASWSWNGPNTSNGGTGHKHVLLFDNEETTAGRWETIIGTDGETNLYMTFAGDFASVHGGTNGSAAAPSNGLSSFPGNGWYEQWFHAKMDDTNGAYEMYIDGDTFNYGTDGDTDRDGGQYFNIWALSRNQNRGVSQDQELDFGPVDVWFGATPPAGSPF